ncbi:hypothetical protein BJY00DRAFT_293576 [Aspergillus carlsbadensis]|nr:hypothetical protein BJY00DRAFT_293576 [Aspergillus carlsbadensis]
MPSEQEPLHDLKLAISSKILEVEGLARAAGDVVVSDSLKQILESEDQLLSLRQALVKRLKRTVKSDASLNERQTWFSNFISHNQKRLSHGKATELASITRHVTSGPYCRRNRPVIPRG